MTLKTIAAAASIFLAMATGATAATLAIDNGQLTGATDVDVDGTLFDVTFVEGTCAALFDGCDSVDDFTFTTSTSALAASQALLDQVFLDSGSFLFDSSPEATFGCSDGSACFVITPFAVSGGILWTSLAENLSVGGGDSALVSGLFLNRDTGFTDILALPTSRRRL